VTQDERTVLRPGDELGDVELVDERGEVWRAADRLRATLLIFHRHLR
jgi:hypothetical protein